MLAGRTLSTFAPRASKAFTFSRATSSGIMIASNNMAGQCGEIAPQNEFLTGVITSIIVIRDKVYMRKEYTHRARAIVAIEIPVDPTVPSKIREPVYGRKSPSRSASSITSRATGQRKAGGCRCHVEHTFECDTVLYAAPWVEVLQKRSFSEAILSPHTLAALAHLRLAKNFNTQRITERVDPNQRGVSCMIRYAISVLSTQEYGRQPMMKRTDQSRYSI